MIHEEPPRGIPMPAKRLAMPGIEQSRLDCHGPHYWPLYFLTGFKPEEVGFGEIVGVAPLTEWLTSSRGELSPGVIGFTADAPLGVCMRTLQGPWHVPVTVSLEMQFLGTTRPGRASALVGRGKCIHADGNVLLSDGTVEDSSGQLLARTSARAVIIRLPEMPIEEPGVLEYDGPHPYQRPHQGEHIPATKLAELSGLQLLRGQADGSLPLSPLSHLFGLKPVVVEEGSATLELPLTDWLTMPVYGGVLALLCAEAMQAAAETLSPASEAPRLMSMSVSFLRPALHNGEGALRCEARVVETTRSYGLVECTIESYGKKLTRATGTFAKPSLGRAS